MVPVTTPGDGRATRRRVPGTRSRRVPPAIDSAREQGVENATSNKQCQGLGAGECH